MFVHNVHNLTEGYTHIALAVPLSLQRYLQDHAIALLE